jgi:hypothetical protein
MRGLHATGYINFRMRAMRVSFLCHHLPMDWRSGVTHYMHTKLNLESKLCPVCQRPFTWRRKWAKDWEQVIYCSNRCRKEKHRVKSET